MNVLFLQCLNYLFIDALLSLNNVCWLIQTRKWIYFAFFEHVLLLIGKQIVTNYWKLDFVDRFHSLFPFFEVVLFTYFSFNCSSSILLDWSRVLARIIKLIIFLLLRNLRVLRPFFTPLADVISNLAQASQVLLSFYLLSLHVKVIKLLFKTDIK
jgi:hypothetical protein